MNIIDENFVNNSGVYIYYQNNQCLYVGMTTTSFKKRHKGHLNTKDKYAFSYDKIVLYNINNKIMIPSIELFFITKLQPLYNKRDTDLQIDIEEEILNIFLKDKKEYPKKFFEELCQQYTRIGKRDSNGQYIRPQTIDLKNKERIALFDWEAWGGRELFGEVAEEFKQAIKLKNKDYSLMAVSGIYKHFPQLFECKKRKKIDGKRVWVYELKKGIELLGGTLTNKQ